MCDYANLMIEQWLRRSLAMDASNAGSTTLSARADHAFLGLARSERPHAAEAMHSVGRRAGIRCARVITRSAL
jgi:hypothetical protein